MNEIGEPVPESTIINTLSQVDEAIAKIGLPAVVRPAYTLGGAGGGIGRTREELTGSLNWVSPGPAFIRSSSNRA